MADKAVADKSLAEADRKMTCPAANKGKDIGQSTPGMVSACDLEQMPTERSICCGADKIHLMCDMTAKTLGDGSVIGQQNLCYSYGVKQKTKSGSIDGPLGQTDWTTPTSQPDWVTPISQSVSDVSGDTVSACDKNKCEDVRLRQWRAAGIALKHALNHITRSQSSDCTRDTGHSDVTLASITSDSVVDGQCQAMRVKSKDTDAMNEMLDNAKTLHGEGLNETCPKKEPVGQACGSCGKMKGDTKASQHGDTHDKMDAASNVNGSDTPVNLQQLRERIRKITEKLPISTDQTDHTLVRRQHQSCKVTRLSHIADTDDSDINDPSHKHDKEVRKHVKASRRRSSAGKPVSPMCIAEGQGHEAAADEPHSGSSTDPGIVLHAGEQTSTAATSQNGSKVLEPDHMSKDTDNGVRKHLPHARCATGSIPASRPKGLTEADSVANLADVESCTESFDVTEKSSDEKEADVAGTTASGWCDESHIQTIERKSTSKETNVATPLFNTPCHDSSLFTLDGDKESDDGFDDLCDLVLDTDESVEEEIEIHVEDIGDFPSGDSSGNSNDGCDDGDDADDEFECDCTMCHNIGEAMWAARNEAEFAENEEGDSVQRDVSDGYDQPFNFSLSEVCPLDLLLRQSGHHDILQAMFHNVITQMLTVYPDLMSDQVPPLVSDSYIDGLPSVSIKPNGEDDLTCPICLCNFEAGEDAKSLPCQHLFHHLCIKVWIHKSGTCPVCRFILTPDS